uniref:Large ribosomal subunit protein uL4m n=2 Tax=Macaca mulatta TaxID=9544 RepID=A0A5F7ZRV7_MACMU
MLRVERQDSGAGLKVAQAVPAKDGQATEDQRDEPRGPDEQEHAAALVAAVQLDLGNGHVALDGDGQEAEDRGRERDEGRALPGKPLHGRQPQRDRAGEQGIGYEGHACQQIRGSQVTQKQVHCGVGGCEAMLQLVRAGARAWLRPTGCRGLSSLAEEAARPTENPEQVAVASEGLPEPVLRKVELPVPAHRRPVQAWVESLRGFEQERVGLADLHPDVFATAPRLDILHQVAMWQKNFKRISYAKTKTRAEVRGGGRKPWPQKGTGRARHGSIRSPLWRGGGVAHGPRGPTSYYYMLPMKVRALGLKVALSIKLAQDDLHIMDSLELPTRDPQYLTELARYRRWGDSVLLVDLTYEEMPQSIVEATSRLKTFNLIPAVGLNVHSMLKHQTLVLTLPTIAFLEDKLLWQDSRYKPLYPFNLPYSNFP